MMRQRNVTEHFETFLEFLEKEKVCSRLKPLDCKDLTCFLFHSTIGSFLCRRKKEKNVLDKSVPPMSHLSVIPIDLYGFPGLQKPQTSMKFPQKYGPPIYILGENDINCDRCDRCYLVQLKVGNKKFYLLIQNDDENAKTAPSPHFFSFFLSLTATTTTMTSTTTTKLSTRSKKELQCKKDDDGYLSSAISPSQKKLFAIFKLISTSSLSSLSTTAATTATTPPVTNKNETLFLLSFSFISKRLSPIISPLDPNV